MSTMTLHALLQGEVPVLPPFDPVLTGLTSDSNAIRPGDAFIALRGARTHGLRFAMQADAAGAAAIVFEPPAPDALTLPGTVVAVDGLRRPPRPHGRPLPWPAFARAGVTGVTGTNGKTSTVQLLAQALTCAATWPAPSARSAPACTASTSPASAPRPTSSPCTASSRRCAMPAHERGDGSVLARARPGARRRRRLQGRRVHQPHPRPPRLPRHDGRVRQRAKARLFAWPGLEAAVVNLDDPFGAACCSRSRRACAVSA
jgi:UDP-N-acetylmuramoyl-L-alanyl-D-glutamate--2,6-diaminopimelate ligase